jgi:hypothetical protein
MNFTYRDIPFPNFNPIVSGFKAIEVGKAEDVLKKIETKGGQTKQE